MPSYARSHARNVSHGVLRRTRTLLSAGLACAASSLGLFAQLTTTTTANDEPIKLNPFTISAKQEKGYRASNSVTGSKVETSLMDTPMAIQAFTEDFIKDVKPVDLYDLTRFSPGVTSQDPGFTAGNTFLS